MKHTPGPWKVVDCDYGDLEIHGGKTESLVTCMNIHNPYNENNALLIAAAPDLLEALEELLEAYAPSANNTAKKEGFESLHSSVKKAIRATIKARGE
jgi:hypothetical protein